MQQYSHPFFADIFFGDFMYSYSAQWMNESFQAWSPLEYASTNFEDQGIYIFACNFAKWLKLRLIGWKEYALHINFQVLPTILSWISP